MEEFMTKEQFMFVFNSLVRFSADMEYAAIMDKNANHLNRRAEAERTDSRVHPLRIAARDSERDAVEQRLNAWRNLSMNLHKLQQEMAWGFEQIQSKEAFETYSAQRRVERTKE